MSLLSVYVSLNPKLKIIHPNHNLNIGDTIYLSNVLSFNKIPSSVLNTSFKIHQILPATFTQTD